MPISSRKPPAIRQGNIYLLADCPSLDSDTEKTRPVVVFTPNAMLKSDPIIVLVVAVSHTTVESKKRVELPNKTQTLTCATGLGKESWAIPSWLIAVKRENLTVYIGSIGGNLLARVLQAVALEMKEKRAKTLPHRSLGQ